MRIAILALALPLLALACQSFPTPFPPTPTPTLAKATATPQRVGSGSPIPTPLFHFPTVTPFAIDRYGEPESAAARTLMECHPELPILPQYLAQLQEVEVQYAEGEQPGFEYAGQSTGRTIIVWTDVAHPCEVILHEVLHSLQLYLDPLEVDDFPIENPEFAQEFSTRYQDSPVEAYAFYGEFAICGDYSCFGASGGNVCAIEPALRSYYPWFNYSSCPN